MAMAVIRVGIDTSDCQAQLAPDERDWRWASMGHWWGGAWENRVGNTEGTRGAQTREEQLSPHPGYCPQGAVGWPWAPS